MLVICSCAWLNSRFERQDDKSFKEQERVAKDDWPAALKAVDLYCSLFFVQLLNIQTVLLLLLWEMRIICAFWETSWFICCKSLMSCNKLLFFNRQIEHCVWSALQIQIKSNWNPSVAFRQKGKKYSYYAYIILKACCIGSKPNNESRHVKRIRCLFSFSSKPSFVFALMGQPIVFLLVSMFPHNLN